MPEVITDHLDLWTSALLTKSTAGRGSNGKLEAYGIKKLRELILELAVRGKLVPQNPDDEPASEQLERTFAEKKRLIKEGVIREAKEPVFSAEAPDHGLPASWVWTNLYAIGEIAPRNEETDAVDSSFVPMQAISEKYGVPVQHEVKAWGEIKSGFTHFQEEDVVLAKITPCFQNGKSAVMRGLTNGFGAGTTELHVYRSINSCTVPEYVLIYLKSPRFISDGIPKMTGTAGQKRITRDFFCGNHFPLPPFAEQHRIVSKVDELMALCDQLEQQQTDSIAAHQALVETLLGTLTRVESQQEFSVGWARIANHFDTLFTTELSIVQLKQTILELAVRGKLVAQDSNDEPASVLRERAEEEKALLIKQGKIRKQKDLPPIAEDEMPFQLPFCWSVVRLGAVSHLITKGTTPTSLGYAYVDSGIAFIKVENIDRGRIQGATISEYIDEQTNEALQRSRLQAGDVLFSIAGTIGKTCIVHEEDLPANTNQALAIIRGTSAVFDTRYLLIQLDSYVAEATRSKARGGAMPNISLGDLTVLVLPVPPFAEQLRIVAKVDELMALCDTLKARLTEAKTTKIHLADAIVEQAIC